MSRTATRQVSKTSKHAPLSTPLQLNVFGPVSVGQPLSDPLIFLYLFTL